MGTKACSLLIQALFAIAFADVKIATPHKNFMSKKPGEKRVFIVYVCIYFVLLSECLNTSSRYLLMKPIEDDEQRLSTA